MYIFLHYGLAQLPVVLRLQRSVHEYSDNGIGLSCSGDSGACDVPPAVKH